MSLLNCTILETHEYCEAEEFRATCNPDEVVIMQAARYGRMTIGRCVIRYVTLRHVMKHGITSIA